MRLLAALLLGLALTASGCVSAYRETDKKRVKVAVKVVDIFGNDTMTIVDVAVGRRK